MKKIIVTLYSLIIVLLSLFASQFYKISKSPKIEILSRVEHLSRMKLIHGADISHYQGKIDWELMKKSSDFEFIIIRSSFGTKADRLFAQNIRDARACGYLVGAYHYYNPDMNSAEQAEVFCRTFKMKKEDFLPIIDIENLPKRQSMESLKKGVRNFISIIERNYGVKPIIYSGHHFYQTHLKGSFDDCPKWIAGYSEEWRDEVLDYAHFWQYTDSLKVKGIPHNTVDGNWLPGDKLKDLLNF